MALITIQQVLIDALTVQGFQLIKDEEEFLVEYPKPLSGCYRPQPWDTPEEYPVLIKEEAVINNPNPNGSAFAVLSYVYL